MSIPVFAPTREAVIRSCRSITDPSQVDLPHRIAQVSDRIPAPETCHLCGGVVSLVNNARFYGGREYGWPLAYACHSCHARVGCHRGTTIPLGTLANKEMMEARQKAHEAFDPYWKGLGLGARRRAYRRLARATCIENPHISWLGIEDCMKVISACQRGI